VMFTFWEKHVLWSNMRGNIGTIVLILTIFVVRKKKVIFTSKDAKSYKCFLTGYVQLKGR
jgi:hypothetical protein